MYWVHFIRVFMSSNIQDRQQTLSEIHHHWSIFLPRKSIAVWTRIYTRLSFIPLLLLLLRKNIRVNISCGISRKMDNIINLRDSSSCGLPLCLCLLLASQETVFCPGFCPTILFTEKIERPKLVVRRWCHKGEMVVIFLYFLLTLRHNRTQC